MGPKKGESADVGGCVSHSGTLGLVAGAGRFPGLVLDGARRAGLRVVVVGLRGCCDESVRGRADVFYNVGIARLGRWIRIFRREQAFQAIMAGQVRKVQMLALPWWRQWLAHLPDWTSMKVWYLSAADRRNETLLRAVADEMDRKGIELIDSTTYCRDALATEGVLTRKGLSSSQAVDAALGWKVAKEMGRLDVGQSVAVKDKDVIAVEAIEGTDAMIARAGALCRKGGWTLVKVAKPHQDMRFDVPTVGPETIERLAEARAGALVIEADKTLLIDRERTLVLADDRGIAVLGWKDGGDHTTATKP
ncbi:MAG: UDP-2,3-diacylglucosamine diphosphatase LpxI [Phycisphaerae bacterium]|nr:UDP-2,3-diacylglucosamine diphosphatase LpxI [Phycisphaerae bacterium]